MSDTSLNKFLGQGDDTVEGAFTPDPPTTAADPQPLVLFLNTEAPTAPALKWWDGDSFELVAVAPAVVKIEEQTPSATGTITFSSLGSYTHLEIRYVARSTQSATSEDMALRFNGDTAGNYDTAVFYNASATTVAAAEGLAATSASAGNLPAANATAGRAGTGVIRINDYRGTTFTKQVTAENGNFVGTSTGNWSIRVWIPHWRSTAAITSITLLLGAGNYVAGSKFSLYGIT